MINTSGYYSIGTDHIVCDDYVIYNETSIILADGCSESKHASVGARVLAHSIENLRPTDLTTWKAVGENVNTILSRINIRYDEACATLLWLEASKDSNYITLNMCGDGVYACRRRDTQELEIYSLFFPSRAPYYLCYNYEGRERYLEEFGDDYVLSDQNNKIEHGHYLTDYPNGIMTNYISTETYDIVAVFSDGIASLGKAVVDLVPTFLGCKGFAGNFAGRRAKAALKELAKEGFSPTDDFSVGIMYIE
jgi:hypothetical protein